MGNIILSAIATVFTIGYCIWYWIRTPKNLRKWYCLPVFAFVICATVLMWYLALTI